jgi:predicted DNA-binding protein
LVAFRAERELVKRIDALAAAEQRSRANYLRVALEKLIQQPTEDRVAS